MDYLFIAIVVAGAFFLGRAYGRYQTVMRILEGLSDKEISDLENLWQMTNQKR